MSFDNPETESRAVFLETEPFKHNRNTTSKNKEQVALADLSVFVQTDPSLSKSITL